MKKSVLMALTIPFLLLAFVGCSKDDAEKSDLKVRFKVLNAKGEERVCSNMVRTFSLN